MPEVSVLLGPRESLVFCFLCRRLFSAIWLYLMKSRCRVIFLIFVTSMLKFAQFSGSLKVLRSNNVEEYFSHALSSYLGEHEILHQSSCVDTPSQNEVVE